MIQIRDMAPSKGPRRYPKFRRNNKPIELKGTSLINRDERLIGMYQALKERGWRFMFTVNVDSPHGFKSQGIAPEPHDALSIAINGKRMGL